MNECNRLLTTVVLLVRIGGRMDNQEQLFQTLQKLVDAWCDRRALQALRYILRGYPLSSPLTDGWAELIAALKDVRAFAREELSAEELSSVDDCVRVIERRVTHRS